MIMLRLQVRMVYPLLKFLDLSLSMIFTVLSNICDLCATDPDVNAIYFTFYSNMNYTGQAMLILLHGPLILNLKMKVIIRPKAIRSVVIAPGREHPLEVSRVAEGPDQMRPEGSRSPQVRPEGSRPRLDECDPKGLTQCTAQKFGELWRKRFTIYEKRTMKIMSKVLVRV